MTENKTEHFKETEFDSSVATLKRIDAVIKQIYVHSIRPSLDDKLCVIDLLECLFAEGRVKFTKTELEKCTELQTQIKTTQDKWGKDLITSKRGFELNPRYLRGWSDLWLIIKKYQHHLMQSMNDHNLLLRDTKDGMSKFTGK